MSVKEIGCCCAYCKTCRVFIEKACKGCKTGYASGERDIEKARCAMKVCCIKKGFETCADCGGFEACATINGFYAKKGYKYKKYRQAAAYIREQGYVRFLKVADNWRGAYGKY